MLNEELATRIGKGENRLVPLLWDNMKRFYSRSARRFYYMHCEKCMQCGVTVEDIQQESYFAMLDSINAYNSRKPEQATLLFITFCGYPFKTHAGQLIGVKSAAYSRDPLNMSNISLDEPIQIDDGDITRQELIADSNAEAAYQKTEDADYCRAIRKTINQELNCYPKELEALTRVCINGETLMAASAAMGISFQYVRILKQKAIKRLKRSSKLREMYLGDCYRHVGINECQRQGSIVEQITEKIITIRN